MYLFLLFMKRTISFFLLFLAGCIGLFAQSEYNVAMNSQRASAYYSGARERNADGIVNIDNAGFTADYLYGRRLWRGGLLWAETGAMAQYLTHATEVHRFRFRENLLSLGVPVLLTADVPVPGTDNWRLLLSAGVAPQYFVLADFEETSGTREGLDYFDWVNYGAYEAKVKRFQFAWQARLAVQFRQAYLTFMFTRHFTDLFEYRSEVFDLSKQDTKNCLITFNTGVGVRF